LTKTPTIIFLSFCFASTFSQNMVIKGIVYDKDSITPMPFSYVVNKNSSSGTLADEAGNFSLTIHTGDTVIFSYLGYTVTKIFTHLLKDSVRNSLLTVKVFLRPKLSEFKPVIIYSHSITKEAKELYERRINEYHRGISSPLASPISFLYYTFSKKGKELQKLVTLYQQMLVEETKEHRLSSSNIRAITGNDTLDVKEFLNASFLPDQFVLSASDYDLFLAVKNCYKRYMVKHFRKK